MTGRVEYAGQVRAWAGQLRVGSTQTWAEFLAAPAIAALPWDADAPLPGAGQLELVRRLAMERAPEHARLAELVFGTAGGGRGRVDVPLPWPADDTPDHGGPVIGTPPVASDELSADEVLRVAAAVLVRLLAAARPEPAEGRGRSWRPWRRGVTLLGAPATVALLRGALHERGLREGGARTTYLVVGAPLEELMAQRWSARVRAGAGMRWQRMWRTAEVHDRVPPGIAVPALAARLADEVGPSRVHVILGADADAAALLVGEVLGIELGSFEDRHDSLATDLLRRVNPLLTLAVGEDRRREIVTRVWPEVAAGEDSGPLGVPAGHWDWAVRTGERMATALTSGRYAVHGDPALVVPARRPGVRRAPDPDDVLRHALRVIGRAWQRYLADELTAREA